MSWKLALLIVVAMIWMIVASLRGGGEKPPVSTGDDYLESSTPLPAPVAAAPRPKSAPSSAPVATPARTASPAMDRVACRKASEPPRYLDLEKIGRGCRLSYRRSDGTEEIGSAKTSARPCIDVRARMIRKLEGLGFSCKPSNL